MATALSSASDQGVGENETISSSFSKTVCLADWWLIKAEKDFSGKRLAVGGVTSKEQQAVRVFSSSPIFKKYDAFTLETADGITVMVKGFINRDRTLQNGFPDEVCSHFLFGFPCDWETYSGGCFRREPCIINTTIFGECNDYVRNREEISNYGNCNSEAIEDEGPSVPISFNVKNVSPKVNVLVQIDPTTNFRAVSFRKDIYGSKGKDEVGKADVVDEVLYGGNISDFGRGGQTEVEEQSYLTTLNVELSRVSERDVDPTVVTDSKMNVRSLSDVKQNKYHDRRVSERLKKLKSNKKENSGSTLSVANENTRAYSMIETFDNATGENVAARKGEATGSPSGCKPNSSMEIGCHSGTRQSSYDLRNVKNKFNKDRASGCILEIETDKVNPVSVDVTVNCITKNIGHKSRSRRVTDLRDVGLKEMEAGEVDSVYKKCWNQLDNTSVLSPKVVKHPLYLSATNRGISETNNQTEDKEPDCVKATDCGGAESANQVEDFHSSTTPDDVKQADHSKVSGGAGGRSKEELSASGKKTRRKLIFHPHACSTRHGMKKCSIVSPDSISRRSKSGRLIVPPLAFWDNQQIVYDADGHITGIQNGLPSQSSAGTKSGAMKKKKRLV